MANNQLYNNIGNEIKDALVDGLNNGDFSGLNSAILNSVNAVLDEATAQLEGKPRNTGGAVNTSAHTYSTYNAGDATRRKQQELQKERERQRAMQAERIRAQAARREELREQRLQRVEDNRRQMKIRQAVKSGSAVAVNGKLLPTKLRLSSPSNILKIVFGSIDLAIFLPFALIFLSIAESGEPGYNSVAGITSALSAIGAGLMISGIRGQALVGRARRYAMLCGEKMYMKISELSNATGASEAKLVKDIKRILRAGYYPEGYLDEANTTLMLSRDVYNQYSQLMDIKQEQNAMASEQGELTNAEQSELDIMIHDGNEAIRKLHVLNENIPGEVITNKLTCLEKILEQIFKCVREHPEQMDRMHKLMDYYLPTMLKLVEAYDEYDKVNPQVPEVEEAKAEIEKTLDTINEAFIQLLNNLFQESVWDVTTDAQVLKTMLAQDGLAVAEK